MQTQTKTCTHAQWLAVRCCCQPTKVLGFIRVVTQQRHPALYKLELVDCDGGKHDVSVKQIVSSKEIFEFEIDREMDKAQTIFETEVAIYSEDRGIDFWRCFEAFLEIKDTPASDTAAR